MRTAKKTESKEAAKGRAHKRARLKREQEIREMVGKSLRERAGARSGGAGVTRVKRVGGKVGPTVRKRRKLAGPVVIAIDGPVGSGKSTIARELAKRLGYLHLNTGTTYRLLAASALELGVPLDEEGLVNLASRLKMVLDEDGIRLANITLHQDINSPVIADVASKIATLDGVRRVLVAYQRNLVQGRSVVAEGRDTTTVVFPDATLKIYLTAREEVRARRRLMQLRGLGIGATFEEVLAWIRNRDQRDITRAHSPLTKAPDAVVIDTSEKTAQEILDEIVRRIKAA